MKKLANQTIAFIDTETTGLDSVTGEIINFAAVIRAADGSETRVEFKMSPEHIETASPKALEINGYTAEAWAGALSQKEGAERMLAALKECILVGHNVSFDVDFIKATLSRHLGEDAARKLGYHKIDTVTIAYTVLAPCGLDSLSLANVCTFIGVTNENAHTAMADVLRCMECYDKLVRAGWFQRLIWKLRAPKAKS